MLFEEKTQNNIMADLIATVDSDISTEEGTLIDHSFRGAAAEFEQAYIGLGLIEQNGYAETADREHLILRAKERGITPLEASNALWKASFNTDIPLNARFSAGELTYICTEKKEDQTYRLMCEQSGTIGNTKQGELAPIEYIDGYDTGELTELITPARDEEKTEDFRARYLSTVTAAQAFGGNRAWYKQAMHEIPGVGACKIYRATKEERRIKIYFLNSLYQKPSDSLAADVQEIIDPIGKQGEGEGKAAWFHVVDICPCAQEAVNIETEITIDSGYASEDVLTGAQAKLDGYYLELAKSWENEEYLTVRILKVNAAIASVEGVIDVQNTALNGKEENLLLDPNAIPVRGEIVCRE
jgi:uncharacterized phage protein gp47/JayE